MIRPFGLWSLFALAAALTATAAAQPIPVDFTAWLDREVMYLLTPAERAEARRLADADARAAFVRAFWKRRDPTPDTPDNEFYDEHQRRLVEADRLFASGRAGRFTDRGRIFILWGPPDFIERHPAGTRGGLLGQLSLAPELATEIWTYEHPPVAGAGGAMRVVFVDSGSGDYRLLADPADANVAYVYRLNTPANPLQYESAAFLDPATGLRRTDATAEVERAQALGPGALRPASMGQFEKVLLAAELSRPPDVLEQIARSQRIRRLEGEVAARVFTRRFPLAMEAPVFETDGGEAYCPIAAAIPGDALAFEPAPEPAAGGGIRQHASAAVRGEIRDLADGRIVRTFVETIRFRLAPDTYARGVARGFTYQKAMTLPPGRYRLELVIADERAGTLGRGQLELAVPASQTGLRITAPFLAESAGRGGEPGPFALGTINVRPRPDRIFSREERIYVVYQVAGFQAAPTGPALTADYTILSGERVVRRTGLERVPVEAGQASAILAYGFEAGALEAGSYILQVKVIDHASARHAVARLPFAIR
ncbi:MAG TPA: GWxTD domain-containing protein [Vicinamibacterales bacterium]|nr:GWxTD domain-containing protein [Vicinamibacterales bacterium]